jgi:hypothetical protein
MDTDSLVVDSRLFVPSVKNLFFLFHHTNINSLFTTKYVSTAFFMVRNDRAKRGTIPVWT